VDNRIQKEEKLAPITKTNKIPRQIRAILAAFVLTGVIAFAMLALGVSALASAKNGEVANIAASPQASPLAVQPAAFDPSVLDQLQNLIAQYQLRETQYQSELEQAARQLDQANLQLQQNQTQTQQVQAQTQQYQTLIQALVNAGVIQITADGSVVIPSPARSSYEQD
jgi:TolA-binding protein